MIHFLKCSLAHLLVNIILCDEISMNHVFLYMMLRENNVLLCWQKQMHQHAVHMDKWQFTVRAQTLAGSRKNEQVHKSEQEPNNAARVCGKVWEIQRKNSSASGIKRKMC